MGKIKYSVRETTVKWGVHAGEKRYSANLQTSGTISLDKFAEHMADHDCKYNKGDIYSVLIQMSKCIREFILDGYMVSLGDLGVICPRIKQKASTVREEYATSNITDLYATLKIGPALVSMRGEASFEYAPTLANQALLVAAIREGLNSVNLVKPTAGSNSNENDNQNENGSSGSSGANDPSTGSTGSPTGSGTNENGSSGSSGSNGSSENGGSQSGSSGSQNSGTGDASGKPTISGIANFQTSTTVTITGPEGATIRYTSDGSTPTATNGEVYTEPFTLNDSATIKAVAVVDGVASEVTTRVFTKSSGD